MTMTHVAKDSVRARPVAMALRVGPSHDAYEREAEQVGDAVARGDLAPWMNLLRGTTVLSHHPATSRARAPDVTSRTELASHTAGRAPLVASRAVRGGELVSGGIPLAPDVADRMETRLGFDFSAVRIHADARADKLARFARADAFTVGDRVYFRAGQYAPRTPAGDTLLTHELAHVVQHGLAPWDLGVLRKSRAKEVDDQLGFFASRDDAIAALDLLERMTDADLNDTLADLLSSGVVLRLLDLGGRPWKVRLLELIGRRGTRANQEAWFRTVPGAPLSAEDNLRVFIQQHAANFGARGPFPTSNLMRLISADPSAPFSGSGATGLNPSKAPMSLKVMEGLRDQHKLAQKLEAEDKRKPEAQRSFKNPKYERQAGMEMLYEWSNPLKQDPNQYLTTLSKADRSNQARLLLTLPISSHFVDAYPTGLPSRLQVVRASAKAHRLSPEIVAAIILAEQRDQSRQEDAADFRSGTLGPRTESSIGLGQVTGTTAQRYNLFADLSSPTSQMLLPKFGKLSTRIVAWLLASDEANIFATARYLRIVADLGATKNINAPDMANTKAWVGAIDLGLYAKHASVWTDQHIRLIGSEYTSKPFDDGLSTLWGDFVLAAYHDVKAAALF
jgi:hypothetical protein